MQRFAPGHLATIMLVVVGNVGIAEIHRWVVATAVAVVVPGRLAEEHVFLVGSSGDVRPLEVDVQVCLRALVHRRSKRVSLENVERVWLSPESPESSEKS